MPCKYTKLTSISNFFIVRYGERVAAVLRASPLRWSPPAVPEGTSFPESLYWCHTPVTVIARRLSKVDSTEVSALCSMYSKPVPPSKTRKFALISSLFNRRTHNLYNMDDIAFLDEYFAAFPFALLDNMQQRIMLLRQILSLEYGEHISTELLRPPTTHAERQREARREAKIEAAHTTIRLNDAAVQSWPSMVSKQTIFKCINEYYNSTIWKAPVVCSVCSRQRENAVMVPISIAHDASIPEFLHVLQITDTAIIQKCIVQQNSPQFLFDDPRLDGLMIDSRGIQRDEYNTILNMCSECHTPLLKNVMPRFALANKLYRGRLPAEFQDLTWVEERVCAIYSNTAVVTRLYQSSDPAQPKVFHGNTCAHEMNVVSTANVLPRTPADVNSMLSIVFVGPGNFKPECLKATYRVRKQKIWRFLVWLKHNNLLYAEFKFDEAVIQLYPEDGLLPDIESRVVQDSELDGARAFKDETAGFSEHPADIFVESNASETDEPSVLIDKMGVSDPECDRISGRTFTAFALRNLLGDSENKPDLVIHRSSTAVSEYNNPTLMPGMYPTLFPFGIGGFEDKSRVTAISFNQQANYYLDIANREFRYHFSYMFVALNIIQRSAAHLQTHFTVRKSYFKSVTKKLVAVSSETLRSVAHHLEQEGKYSDLTTEQKGALDLLKHVNTVAARIPGSQASKIFARNEIRSYCGYFALPHIYLTLNPNPLHNPLFQLMFGDNTIDLTERFPALVPNKERALRLAKDPVAAADFFHFSVVAIFQHLFGWNYDAQQSTEDGGILGKLRAFYGTAEFTNRGSLHGHFLLWLYGGVNPDVLHQYLKERPGYDTQFFQFFEDIIHHHLPDVDIPDFDRKLFEPRHERPPKPPVSADAPLHVLDEWDSVFRTEIKKCGEVLQRHVCRDVCHKYGNKDRCRFLFPHEIVDASYYDAETESVVLLCRDGTVNYFNPYILVFCRHNHDIKCILSGKAAKAAMYYITDYITKMDLKTYEMLSLLSRVVANIKESPAGLTPIEGAKTLLHKCLSQFMRQQQIHAQQAARYIRGFGDSISSHTTVPMMSALLISYIKANETNAEASEENDTVDADETENISLKIAVDRNGTLRESNQVTDYIFRSNSLASMAFYDFSRCVRLEKKANRKTKNTPQTRLGVLTRHALESDHPLSETHDLVEHTNAERGEGFRELIPRIIGMSIPRTTHNTYSLFALAHFKPFSWSAPLLLASKDIEETFKTFTFTPVHFQIMKNWEAMHECQDARDAERLKKKSQLAAESNALTKSVQHGHVDLDETVISAESKTTATMIRDLKCQQFISLMEQCGWISNRAQKHNENQQERTDVIMFPEPTKNQFKVWNSAMKLQENQATQARRNAMDPENQIAATVALETENGAVPFNPVDEEKSCPETNLLMSNTPPATTTEELVNSIGKKYNLNAKQWIVYRIIASTFIKQYVEKTEPVGHQPLRALMTGPGGTGKTHVVKAVQELMKLYGLQHMIRFLGPTGGSAKQIGGMTVHKGLGLSISSNDKGKGNRKPGSNAEDYTVMISVKNRTLLREEWKNVQFIFIDEVSLVSAQLMAEIDHALRYAKEKPDEWFGGVHIIFAGDFYQFPPVGGTALYSPITPYSSQSTTEIMKRLGRLAWKSVNTVISLSEQQRMKDDIEYAGAVNRLRTRECTFGDVELFNSRLVKSAISTDGIDMLPTEHNSATMLVSTNLLREIVNHKKAAAVFNTEDLIVCAALDKVNDKTPSEADQQSLLALNLSRFASDGALPGFLSFAIGMPVVFRGRNISTELGITNGSQGFVRKIFTGTCPNGLTIAKCIIVEFPDSNVHLPGLPQGFFPIAPVSWSFSTIIRDKDGSERTVRVTRQQMSIQPAFAVTGHSAQGKTLPFVISSIHEGGFASYVAASRARTRHGLFITHPVTIEQLNKPVGHDLHQETKRLEALQWNTLVTYGIETGELQHIPDPESEKLLTGQKPATAKFETPAQATKKKHNSTATASKDIPKVSLKRKLSTATPEAQHGFLVDGPKPKKMKQDTRSRSEHTQEGSPVTAGCVWSHVNYSCAYDSLFMALFSMYRYAPPSWRSTWKSESHVYNLLADMFENLMIPENIGVHSQFNYSRDLFRDHLSYVDPSKWRRFGQVFASAADIVEYLSSEVEASQILIETETCSQNCTTEAIHYKEWNIPGICANNIWCNNVQHTSFERTKGNRHHNNCPNCSEPSTKALRMPKSSAWIYFEVQPNTTPRVIPLSSIEIPGLFQTNNYSLSAVIYSGFQHFTARWADNQGIWWSYDGQHNNGTPWLTNHVSNDVAEISVQQPLHNLVEFDGREAHIYVYRLISG